MNNIELANRFAQGKTKGKGSNMFIEGDTIYSYGHHFPIARRIGETVLLTMRTYSHSTAKHINHVRYSLLGCNVINVPDVECTENDNLSKFACFIARQRKELESMRTGTKRHEQAVQALSDLCNDFDKYRQFVGVQ